MAVHQVGIRELVEFLLRTGDLSPVISSENTAQEGSRIHRKIQHSRPSSYQSEVALKTSIQYLDDEYVISGRADGIDERDGKPLIEEIKTSDLEFQSVPDSTLQLYWAQVKVYAYIVMHQADIKSVDLQLTYVQTPDEKITTKALTISKTESELFFTALVTEFEQWIQLRHELDERRITSAKQLKFPFADYRPGQHKLATNVYKTILLEKHLFVEAPTGTGKTISTLFPAIKSMGEELISRVFYFTAKQSTRHVAENTISLMAEKGLTLKSITLTAKDKITFPEEKDVPPEKNPYMVGYYDRVRPAIKDLIQHVDQITKDTIQEYAQKHKVDPFEFSLDVSLFCDIIICDYNYLFDPQVHLQRFFSVPDKSNCFLVDEVHNLVQRSREMYSATLESSPIDPLIRQLSRKKASNEKVIKRLQSLKRSFKRYSKPASETVDKQVAQLAPLDNFNNTLETLIETIHQWLATQTPSDTVDAVVDYYLECRRYFLISTFYDETYRTRVIIGDHTIIFRQFCMDPSKQIKASLNLGRAAILFSATLSPISYYQQVLGNEADSLCMISHSSFPQENCQVVIANNINTLYANRENSLKPICDTIKTLISQKTGHYMMFFPSMAYLNATLSKFVELYPDVTVINQKPDMDNASRTEFLDNFRSDDHKTKVGFALLGGIFSEGIDLKNDQLIGVGIVSVGLPGMNKESDLIRDYFDSLNGQGFSFAYQLPGFNNVSQAAGRVIRTDEDKGVIVLMDQRFNQTRYRSIFPKTWSNIKVTQNSDQLKNVLHHFWQNGNT
ncbi:helicase C-terminal domain-containing protein [Lentilactobacillus parabuchneri]|uniref:helicase C-terminal domain-containing protein n=1 Tax=Lentilactobacillus parabuchneri TaxID=152331 RepID=UPI000A0F95F2|nr:helicase C-terminal domain-containing protein [Lentilactobacillus parabuchneri]MDN6781109.1 PD-(D/E)XK nuclease family protein [Lentilactobacillus parabuchneri]MDN6808358.1 PD-(D/E)XK nuclease family protein [Lentilactobacillus parabuchneri]ORN11129.1 bifunctional ATP-dependent DNA helicase/DNA polymerase III subunit epsilon [Lentilactobacillus parabuchneri]